MNIRSMAFLGSLLFSSTIFAEIENGNFEAWSGNSPDSWTTIDSGITTSESTSIVYSGSSAAQVTVNTGSQGSTDLRQSISVSAGETLNVSVWVRHTEGTVRARLFVDGFQNYSDPTIINSWQQLSYTYTPSSNGTIEVGLRFYDTSGFDGSEIVYVDGFEPTTSLVTGSSCQFVSGSIDLVTDNYGSETSWQISNEQSQVLASNNGYASNNSYAEFLCLDSGSYTFTIFDSYGDGICCQWGNGSYSVTFNGATVASGGSFSSTESTQFVLGGASSGGNTEQLDSYYASAEGLTGFTLKTELYNIINGHVAQGYSAIWIFYNAYERDSYYENDGSILDIYSENPSSTDSYNYTASADQCGNFNSEADCYNREHAFPRSWFGGDVEPMNSDIHHIFATDGYVNGQRSSFPYGEVGSATFTSSNGSRLGSAVSGLGYSGTVFEPIDEFKGDLARAYFYMATRYQNVIANWESNSTSADAILNGTSTQVFETWQLNMLKEWHTQDPVSQKEIDRNDAAEQHQGNRNPFVDYPNFVEAIW